MSKISLTNKRLEYYGLDINDLFWVKNKVLNKNQIRESTDEEIIGYIISNMILEQKDNYNTHALNSLYGFTTNPLASTPLGKSKIEDAIDRISIQTIEKNFLVVYTKLDELLVSSRKSFRDLIYRSNSMYDHTRAFHTIFMAFYNLIIRQSKQIINESGLINELTGIGDDLLTSNTIHNLSGWRFHEKTVKAIIGRIQSHFGESRITDPAYDDWTEQVSNILMQSITEQNLYDFKIGVFNIQDEVYNQNLVLKIAKTLSAINNLGPNQVGYLIVGIADNKEDAELHTAKYGTTYVKKQDLKQAPIQPSSFLQMILSNMKSRRYYGKEILIFQTKFSEPVWYERELFER